MDQYWRSPICDVGSSCQNCVVLGQGWPHRGLLASCGSLRGFVWLFSLFLFTNTLVIFNYGRCFVFPKITTCMKRKYEDENCGFHQEWKEKFAFIEGSGGPFCLICDALLINFNTSNR